ncbi:hypothetical protein ACIBI4_00375 [Streptomyces sp. NPDC050418]|uniref:hypothetical protein n=1 Tax=Streptomyces sp. NPDC050418 TaxID=3365612 RepID=UPI0037972CF9
MDLGKAALQRIAAIVVCGAIAAMIVVLINWLSTLDAPDEPYGVPQDPKQSNGATPR